MITHKTYFARVNHTLIPDRIAIPMMNDKTLFYDKNTGWFVKCANKQTKQYYETKYKAGL